MKYNSNQIILYSTSHILYTFSLASIVMQTKSDLSVTPSAWIPRMNLSDERNDALFETTSRNGVRATVTACGVPLRSNRPYQELKIIGSNVFVEVVHKVRDLTVEGKNNIIIIRAPIAGNIVIKDSAMAFLEVEQPVDTRVEMTGRCGMVHSNPKTVGRLRLVIPRNSKETTTVVADSGPHDNKGYKDPRAWIFHHMGFRFLKYDENRKWLRCDCENIPDDVYTKIGEKNSCLPETEEPVFVATCGHKYRMECLALLMLHGIRLCPLCIMPQRLFDITRKVFLHYFNDYINLHYLDI